MSVVATTTGTYAARVLHREPGPLVVLVATACFVLSLLYAAKRTREAHHGLLKARVEVAGCLKTRHQKCAMERAGGGEASVIKQLVPLGVAAALGVAATLAWEGVGRNRPLGASPREPLVEAPVTTTERTLPLDHPPIGNGSPMTQPMNLPANHPPMGGESPHGAMPAAPDETAALKWQVPTDWQEAPNPSPMRLATYHLPGGAEMSVARAGGSTEANIQRWLSQFDNAGADTREERTIRGLHVTLVRVAGTYAPSPMMVPGAAPQVHPGWALQGAIVETSGSPYFFKLIGPAAAIQSGHASFERLLASFSPQ